MIYRAKTKDCHLIVRARAWFGEKFDEREIDAFARMYLRGFLKPKIIRRGVVEYSGPVGVSLQERMKKPITKRDFLFIIEQIAVAVQKVHANKLMLNKVLLDMRYVYINEVTKEIQFMYVPIKETGEYADVMGFVESVIYSVIPAPEKDMEYVSRFTYFLKSLKIFDADKIERFVAREDISVVKTIKKQNVGQSGFMTSKQKHYYDHYDGQGSDDDPTGLLDEDDEPTGILSEDDDEATGMLDEDEATGYLNEEDADATGLLGQDDEDGTALLDESKSVHYPTLFRVLTEETISINKPVFRLGKERSYVDYFVTNNNAVSRSHADIITRGNKFFVIDLNSKNHTYINDQIIAVQCETEIRDGDRLKLGNEEFIFNV